MEILEKDNCYLETRPNQALTRVSLSREKSRVEREISLSISKIWYFPFLFLLSILESGNKKFSFHSRFSRVERKNSLSTLDFREWKEKILFLLSIFESLILKLSFFLSIFESSNREFNIIYSRWFKIDQPKSVPEVWFYFFTFDFDSEF